MAELVQQIKDDHLTCSICQCFFNHPKALPCLHSFCEGCLRDYVCSRCYDEARCFPCPACQQEVELPNKGVVAFPDNEHLIRLMGTVRTRGALHGNGRTGESLGFAQPQNTQLEPRPSLPDSGTASSSLYPDLSSLRDPPPNYSDSTGLAFLQRTVPIRYTTDNALICFGHFGKGPAEFSLPVGMCISGKYGVPLIHITDQRDNRVLSFLLNGEIKSIFTCEGDIYDIDCDKNDTLYVANAIRHRALACTYNLQGQKMGSYGNHFTFVKPHGIVVNRLGEVVVSTLESKCIVLSAEGKTLQEFGRKTKGKEGFISPYYVAVNSKNEIIISDRDSNSIKIFDRNGKPKKSFGHYGCNKGELHHPLGVACDAYDNIIVADAGNSRLQVFDATGHYKYMLKTTKESVGSATGSDVVPRAVSVVQDKLVVLFTGEEFGEVRVYSYTRSSESKTCKVQ